MRGAASTGGCGRAADLCAMLILSSCFSSLAERLFRPTYYNHPFVPISSLEVGCDHVPGAAKAYIPLTMYLTSSTVSHEGVQEVAIILSLLAICIREHSQLVGERRSTGGSACGQQREPKCGALTGTGRARRRIGGQVVQGLARSIREHRLHRSVHCDLAGVDEGIDRSRCRGRLWSRAWSGYRRRARSGRRDARGRCGWSGGSSCTSRATTSSNDHCDQEDDGNRKMGLKKSHMLVSPLSGRRYIR